MNCNDKKKFRTSEASSKASLRTKGAIDKFLNILDTNLFRKYNKQWSQDARERFSISGSLFYEENNKAIPNKEAFQKIDKAKKIIYETEQGNNKKENVYFNLNSSPEIQFDFKISNIISGNLAKIRQWESNKSVSQEILYNKIQQLGVPKEQLELLKNSDGNIIEEKLTNLLANYSQVIEINTATKDKNVEEGFESIDNRPIPTTYYSNLTVPGGTNYTENEIATPAITPSIKGHAQLSTNNGIGWFRSDEKTTEYKGKEDITKTIVEINGFGYLDGVGDTDKGRYARYKKDEYGEYTDYIDNITEESFNKLIGVEATKTRRILEVQSDLFQKGRDKKDLITQNYENSQISLNDNYGDPVDYDEFGEPIYEEPVKKDYTKENQFLQLLNKDNNWVTFFIKSIIQSLKPVSQEQLDEQYLSQSTSLEELEYRMKELDRQRIEKFKNQQEYFRSFKNY